MRNQFARSKENRTWLRRCNDVNKDLSHKDQDQLDFTSVLKESLRTKTMTNITEKMYLPPTKRELLRQTAER